MPVKRAKNKPSNSTISARQQGDDRRADDARQFGRSRVTNAVARGSVLFLDHSDKRGIIPRRFKDIVGLVTSDLGGPDQLSEVQRQLIRRIASLSVWSESQEARMADGEEIDIDAFQRAAGSLRRLCESIGLQRHAREIGPSLGEVLRRSHRREAEDAEVVSR